MAHPSKGQYCGFNQSEIEMSRGRGNPPGSWVRVLTGGVWVVISIPMYPQLN